jgi:hypothetical protein
MYPLSRSVSEWSKASEAVFSSANRVRAFGTGYRICVFFARGVHFGVAGQAFRFP